MERLTRAALAVGTSCAIALLVGPSLASACTCAGYDSPREQARALLEGSDLAFIGVLKSVKRIGEPPFPGTPQAIPNAFFRYRVKSSYGGDPGRFVRVRSSLAGESCGLPRGIGRNFAIGADRSRRTGVLVASLCSVASPRALRQVAAEGLERTRPSRAGC
jgi:hypothetical protein